MLRLVLVLLLVAPAFAAEVEFAARLPADASGSTDQPAAEEQRSDKERLAVGTIRMLQAQLLVADAQLEHAAARLELQAALDHLGSLDTARGKILGAQQRLARLVPESERLQKEYGDLLGELKSKYKAEACEPTLELRWRCPDAGEDGP